MKHLLIISLLLLNIGCAKSGSSSAPAPAQKSLFSVWTANDGTVLDLRNITIGSGQLIRMTLPSGSQCYFDLDVSGTEEAGNYVLYNATGDCFGYTETGYFLNADSILTFLTGGETYDYY